MDVLQGQDPSTGCCQLADLPTFVQFAALYTFCSSIIHSKTPCPLTLDKWWQSYMWSLSCWWCQLSSSGAWSSTASRPWTFGRGAASKDQVSQGGTWTPFLQFKTGVKIDMPDISLQPPYWKTILAEVSIARETGAAVWRRERFKCFANKKSSFSCVAGSEAPVQMDQGCQWSVWYHRVGEIHSM